MPVLSPPHSPSSLSPNGPLCLPNGPLCLPNGWHCPHNGPPCLREWSSLSPPPTVPFVFPSGPPCHPPPPLLVLPVSPFTLLSRVHPHEMLQPDLMGFHLKLWHFELPHFCIHLSLPGDILFNLLWHRTLRVWRLNFSFLARWSLKMPNEEDSSSQRHHSNYLDWHLCVASWIFVNVWSHMFGIKSRFLFVADAPK